MDKEVDKVTEELAAKYIQKTEKTVKNLKPILNPVFTTEKIEETLSEAKRYLKDAEYYFNKKMFDTSLTSIAYCEGLLDALRILGFVEFSWEE